MSMPRGPINPFDRQQDMLDGSLNVCPECLADKHGNCDGSAWDRALDVRTQCLCTACEPPSYPGLQRAREVRERDPDTRLPPHLRGE